MLHTSPFNGFIFEAMARPGIGPLGVIDMPETDHLVADQQRI